MTSPGSTGPAAATSTGLAPNIAAALAYVLGPITGVLFLVLEKENRYVRFHAAQSITVGLVLIVVAIALSIMSTILAFVPILGWIVALLLSLGLGFVSFVLWIVLMWRAYTGSEWEVPVAGSLARKIIASILIAVIVGVAPGAATQARASAIAQTLKGDNAAIRDYVLTMPKVDSWVAATVAMQRAASTLNQQQAGSLRASSIASLDQMASGYDRVPAIRNSIRGAGLSPKEFATIGLVMMQSLTLDAVLRNNPQGKVPANANPANLRFVKANRELILEKMASLRSN